MLHKLLGFSTVLSLLLTLLPSPALCARGRFHLHHFHHPHSYHPLHRPIRCSKTHTAPTSVIHTHLVTAEVQESPSEPTPIMRAPGHMRIPNNMEAPTCGDGKSTSQVPDSMGIVGIPLSEPKTSGRAFDPTNPTTNKRSLLHPSSSYDHTLPGEEDLTLFIASLTLQKDKDLFSMLPRGHVPPSGPSKNHNSMVTGNPT